MEDSTLSAFMQVHGNQRAVFESLKSFRAHYPRANISLVSDGGADFSEFASPFALHYEHYLENTCPNVRFRDIPAAREYLRRLAAHCERSQSHWVLLLEEDVLTYRRAREFPRTHCAGPRQNPFTPELNAYLNEVRGTQGVNYYYNLSGGSVFHRETYLYCYRRGLDLHYLRQLDDRAACTGDIMLTLLFLVNNQDVSVWEEISEKYISRPDLVIDRDAAFDHNDKRWYGQPFDTSMLLAVTPPGLVN
jgi:hypothetical protein